jgi:hypothetical protein
MFLDIHANFAKGYKNLENLNNDPKRKVLVPLTGKLAVT